MKENVELVYIAWNCLLECPYINKLIKPYYWKRLKMPKQIELMKTENKNGNKKSTHVYYESLWNLKKKSFFIKYAPRAFLLNIADSLFRSCIFIVYWSWFINVKMYLYWMYILLFIACTHRCISAYWIINILLQLS